MSNQQLVRVPEGELEPFVSTLRHQLTMLSEGAHGRTDRHSGLTIWSTLDRSASVYWRWVMTDEGLPILADPLAIKSNLLFTHPTRAATVDDQLIGINMLVRALPWREEVMDHVTRLRLPAIRKAVNERGHNRADSRAQRVALAA